MHAIVTGAGGFVGRALRPALGGPCHALSFAAADWEQALEAAPLAGATIFHLAGRVHRAGDEDEKGYQSDNAGKTRRLAEVAVRRGARRIVFLSTLKVFGEESGPRPFEAGDDPAPQDAYSRSKLAGEAALREVAGAGGVEWVIVRAPLVLGGGARGNLASLLRWADTGWPLPLASIANRRSFVQRDDLARLLVACASSAAAANGLFIAAHPVPMSTPGLVGALRRALGRPARLWAVPPRLLEAAAGALGREERVHRLTRSLEADPSATEQRLGWTAAIDLDAAAAEMARAWRERDA